MCASSAYYADRAFVVVTGVTWQPYYDLHAVTSDGKTLPEVSLIYYANITQFTGEDWYDVTLALSTASSQARGRLSVPVVDSLRVVLEKQYPLVRRPKSAMCDHPIRRSQFSQDHEQPSAEGLVAPAPVGQYHARAKTMFPTSDQYPNVVSFADDVAAEMPGLESTGAASG